MQKKDDPTLKQKELEEAFADHDKDGSGSLSLAEWQEPFEDTVHSMLSEEDMETDEERIAHHRREFESYDANKDGVLDEKELDLLAHVVSSHEENGEAGAEAEHRGAETVTGAEILHALDADGDGKVTFEEYVLDGGATDQDDGDDEDSDISAHDLSLDDLTSDEDLS